MIENKLWKIGNYVVAVKHGKYGFNKDKALFEPELGTITKITNVATDANSIRADGLGQHIYFSKDYVEPFSNFEDAEKYSKRIKIYKNKKFYTKKEDLENKSYFVDIDINFLYYTSFKFNKTICCTNKTFWNSYTCKYYPGQIYVELSKEEDTWFNKCIKAGKYLEKTTELKENYYVKTWISGTKTMGCEFLSEGTKYFKSLENYSEEGSMVKNHIYGQLQVDTSLRQATQDEIYYFLKHDTLTTFSDKKSKYKNTVEHVKTQEEKAPKLMLDTLIIHNNIIKEEDKFIIERPEVPGTENTVYYFKSKSLIIN